MFKETTVIMNGDKILGQLLRSPIFLSTFFSWFLAQLLKVIINILRKKTDSSKSMVSTLLWKTGGMPSSHASAVAALTTSIGFIEGIVSPLFISMAMYAMIVVRDAVGVRRSSGLQARALNKLGKQIQEKLDIEYEEIKEVHGHNAAEVAVGIVLGFFIAIAFCKL